MSEAFTPMDDNSVEQMKRLWIQQQLPNEPNFRLWSQEYAREVWKAVLWCAEETYGVLMQFLERMDVWNSDASKQQWMPKK